MILLKSHLTKFIGTLLIASTLSFLVVTQSFWFMPPEEKLREVWATDVESLMDSGQLPKQWPEVSEVDIIAKSSFASEWVNTAHPKFQTNPAGLYRLEVYVIDWVSNYRYGVVVHYSLFEKTSENKIWESARTLRLGWIY